MATKTQYTAHHVEALRALVRDLDAAVTALETSITAFKAKRTKAEMFADEIKWLAASEMKLWQRQYQINVCRALTKVVRRSYLTGKSPDAAIAPASATTA